MPVKVILKKQGDRFLIMTPVSVVDLPNDCELLAEVADSIMKMSVNGYDVMEVEQRASN